MHLYYLVMVYEFERYSPNSDHLNHLMLQCYPPWYTAYMGLFLSRVDLESKSWSYLSGETTI